MTTPTRRCAWLNCHNEADPGLEDISGTFDEWLCPDHDEVPLQTVTLRLPTPQFTRSDRGFTYLTDFPGTHERSHADRPMVEVLGETMHVHEAEALALAILWLVRNHYQGAGLVSEVRPPTPAV